MTARTSEPLSERLGQLEARLVQIDEGQNKLRGSTDYEDRRQRASLMLEGEEIETELPQLRIAAALEQAKAQNGMQGVVEESREMLGVKRIMFHKYK